MEAPQLGAACSLKRRIPLAPSVSLSVLLLGLGAVLSQGQVIIPPPLTQSYTPPALAPGTPAGSYILSDFDTINYGNLSVNFRFPLIKIGGRGTESAVIMPDFTTYSQWTVYPTPANCGQNACTGWNYSISRITPWSPNFLSMCGVPRIGVRQGGIPCSAGASGSLITNYSQNTLSRITFIGPDGTEMDLIDQKSGGQPQPYTIGQAGYYDRGAVWVTRDGTSAIFTTSGPDVFDTVATAANCSIAPQGINGTLVMRDGTTYTFANTVAIGYATSIADRNGNKITYTYANGSSTLTGITDAVGRSYGVTLGLTDSSSGLKYDLLTYPGGNDVARPIRVYSNKLVNILRADQPQALQSSSVLWPGVVSSSASSTTPETFPGTFISEILLPDLSSYTFKYDSYGNVARIQLPTGGAVEYDWIGQEAWGAATSPDQIFLRCVLTERREYLSSATGTTPSRITKYTTGTAGIAGGVTVSDYDGTGTILQAKTIHNPVAPNWPPLTEAIAYDSPAVGQEPSTQYYDRDGATLLRSISRAYQERSCAGDSTCWWLTNSDLYGRPAHDGLLSHETTTEGTLTKQTASLYDQYNNENNRTESDWGTGSSGGAVLREILTTFNTGASYISANILNLPTEVKILDGSTNRVGDTTYAYDQTAATPEANLVTQNATPAGPRGNRTSISECVSLSTSSTETTVYTYDVAGNVISITDANLHTTTLAYADSYSDGTNRNTYAHVTQVTYPPVNTSTAPQIANWQYDYGTGKPTVATDVNRVNTNYSFASDPLDRLTQIIRAAGTLNVQTNIVYSPGGTAPLSVDVYNDQTVTGDEALRTRTYYDGFGRDMENDQYVSSSSFIQTLETYDAMGRLYTTSSPAVPGSGFAQSWLTTYSPYDGLGRITQVTTPADGASTTTKYSGNQTTFTDQHSVQRATWADGLGRLVQVEEAPASDQFFTTYGYDALDDLLCVNQGSVGAATANPQIYSCQSGLARSRSFNHDGLARLISATNPESGTINYTYDNVGNLLTRTDARFVTCFGTLSGSSCASGYDGLNRPTVKSFSDPNTPQVTYVYDSGAYSLGRLFQVSSVASTTKYSAYDPLGRITSSSQVTEGTTYSFPTYKYNLAGALSSETYPSGRTIATGYDGANRPAWLQGTLGTAVTPYIGNNANSGNWMQYWPSGEPWAFFRGNNLWHAAILSGRLQTAESYQALGNVDGPATTLFQACPGWGFSNAPATVSNNGLSTPNDCPVVSGTKDNGSLWAYDEYAGGPGYTAKTHFQQTFNYDDENRLISGVDTGGWSRNFGYGQWGNMYVSGNNGVPLNPNTAAAATQYNVSNQRVDQSYDAAGNLKSLLPSTLTLTYDAENRQLTAGAYSYTYDGAGHRVTKTGGGATTVYVYDAAGELAAEYSTAATTSPCVTCYLSYDHLGSVRLITDQSGNVISRHDYLPFGEEIPANTAGRNSTWGSGSDTVSQKFTGKERDAESGLDYFGARYYGSALGRFTSADWSAKPEPVPYADFSNPQTLNQYSYVL